MMLNSIGAAIGTLLFPFLSDNFGRKKVFLACLWGNVVIATLQAFSVSMMMYTGLAFLDGLQQQVRRGVNIRNKCR